MCINNMLGKILLLILLSLLVACADGDMEGAPSLNADDIWDRMAEERGKPLPVNPSDDVGSDDSMVMSSEPPHGTPMEPPSPADIEAHRAILQAAVGDYKTITVALKAVLQAPPQEADTEADRQARWRTIQLYLSRLTNLQNNMNRAMRLLDKAAQGEDQVLLDDSRALGLAIAEFNDRIRHQADEFSHPKFQ